MLLPNPEPFCTGVEPALRLSSPQDPPKCPRGKDAATVGAAAVSGGEGPRHPQW